MLQAAVLSDVLSEPRCCARILSSSHLRPTAARRCSRLARYEYLLEQLLVRYLVALRQSWHDSRVPQPTQRVKVPLLEGSYVYRHIMLQCQWLTGCVEAQLAGEGAD